MKNEWTIRWWDVAALVLALMAGVVVIQYAVSRGTSGADFSGAALVDVRIPRPLPELAALLSSGDQVINPQGQKVAEILSVQPIAAANALPVKVPLAGQQDLVVRLRVNGGLRLIRNTAGFPQAPMDLKAGAWCLLTTRKVELSGVVVRVEWLEPGNENRL